MAEIEEAFRDHMRAQSTITALVGQRVYAYEAGDGAIDSYVVVQPVSNPRAAFTQSAYGGLVRLSIYCYANTVARARELGNTILDLYKQYTGVVGDYTVESTEVSNARVLFGPGDAFRYLVDIIIQYT